MKTAAIGGLLIATLSSACTRQEPTANSPQATQSAAASQDPCASASTEVEMTQCWGNVATTSERGVDDAERRLLEWLRQRQQAELASMFEEVQTQWEDFRDMHCEAVSSVYEGGSMAALQRARCRTRLAQQRQRDLDTIVKDATN
jgi:uncharacterized protein YecT (DUF1311 family)